MMRCWQVTEHDGVVIAAHDEPPMQYLTGEGAKELADLIASWSTRRVRAVVLTGAAPGRFITHYSVEELLSLTQDRARVVAGALFRHSTYHRTLQALNDLEKPVIAALNGDTMGGGFELSLACDIRIGQRGDFRYGLPEARLGIIPGGTGTQRLARLMGAGQAIEFCLRARVVDPERALQLGLIHELVDDSREHAVALAQELATMSGTALAMIKRAIYTGSDLTLASALVIERDAGLIAQLSDEATAAMEKYVSLPYEQRRAWLEGGS